MDVVVLVARLGLAAVFALAAVTKLTDPSGTRRAMAEFGLPAALAPAAALLLPLVELGIAAALLPTASAAWAGVAALALLGLFVAAIVVNLALGRRPDCHCFGQLLSEPVGPATLARNGAFAVVAAVVAVGSARGEGISALAWAGDLEAGQWAVVVALAVLSAGVAAQGWLVVNLLQQQGRLLLKLDALQGAASPATPVPPPIPTIPPDPAIGRPAPAFTLPSLDGREVSLAGLLADGKPLVLVFTDPKCGPCNAFAPELAGLALAHASRLSLTVITRRSREENAKLGAHGFAHVLLQQEENEVERLYGSAGTPAAVLVRPDATQGSGVNGGSEAIKRLIAAAVAPPPHAHANGHRHGPAGLPVGQAAPAFTLPDLEGRQVALGEYAGRPTLVTFWNPGCGFCQKLLPDILALEAAPPDGAPRLLVVSTGEVAANRAMGFRADVLLDQGFEVGRSFGASGTPSAVVVDGQGRIGSEVAVGGPRVLSLARGETPVPATGTKP